MTLVCSPEGFGFPWCRESLQRHGSRRMVKIPTQGKHAPLRLAHATDEHGHAKNLHVQVEPLRP